MIATGTPNRSTRTRADITHSGIFRAGNVTLLIGLEDQHVERTLSIIQSHCHAREEAVNVAHVGTQLDALGMGEAITTMVGGAQVFIVHVERVVVV